MALNLSKLALNETATIQLTNPEDGSLLYGDDAQTQPVTVTVYGTSSKVYRQALDAMSKRSLARGTKKPSLEVMREESTGLLVACSIKIDNLELDGRAIDTSAIFKEIYNDLQFSWVREQVDAALSDVSSFLAK
jgi:hypothetical protein